MSWGALWYPGVSWGNKTDPFKLPNWIPAFTLSFSIWPRPCDSNESLTEILLEFLLECKGTIEP